MLPSFVIVISPLYCCLLSNESRLKTILLSAIKTYNVQVLGELLFKNDI